MTQSKILRFRVDEQMYAAIKHLAETEGIKVSSAIRSAISAYLSDEKSHLRRIAARSSSSTTTRRPPASSETKTEPSRRGGNEPVSEKSQGKSEPPDEPEKPVHDESPENPFVEFEGFRWADVRDPAQLALAQERWASTPRDGEHWPDPIPGSVSIAIPSRDDLSGFAFAGRELSLEDLWAHVDSFSSPLSGLIDDPFSPGGDR